jgi:hypothetical protein
MLENQKKKKMSGVSIDYESNHVVLSDSDSLSVAEEGEEK